MNRRTLGKPFHFGMLLMLFLLGPQLARGANTPVSGSYELIEKTHLGSQTKVLVRLHLTNHGPGQLSVRGILLSEFAHPPNAGLRTLSTTLRPGASQEVIQEFVIPRREFEEWEKGVRPRIILEMQTSTGTKVTQAVRLERVSARKGE